MRIVIDYTYAICQREGVARYTRQLVDALTRIDTEDSITLFSSERPRSQGFPTAANIRPKVVPIGSRAMAAMWQRARLPIPIELFAGPAEVVHGPFMLPPALKASGVVTIHDVAHLTIPGYVEPKNAAYLQSLLPRVARRARHIIADSQRTADDLAARLDIPPSKITVVHLGVDPRLAPVHDPTRSAALDARYGLRHPFVLAVGTIEPRKRYEALVAAFAQARSAQNGPHMLAIAGPLGWRADEALAAIEAYGVQDAVKVLDFVPDADLATLYSSADVLAMPARYEGFGLPTVEAMACGTPVVCSDSGSLPEVTGDAAIHVNVDEDGALAAAIERVLTDASLREGMIARGLERAKQFSWEQAARLTLGVYQAVETSRRERHRKPRE